MNRNKILQLSLPRKTLYGLILYGLLSVSVGAVFDASNSILKTAPLPEQFEPPVVQVYAARTWGKKGMLAVHTWVVTKRRGANSYNRHEIVGWQLRWSSSALRSSRWRAYDQANWFGNEATLLVDHRGEGVNAMIDKIDTAIINYPYKDQYQLWPGPNSNTFIAYLGLAVPELSLDLPSTAVGKDYRPVSNLLGRSVSGTGFQISLLGLASLSIGYEEGIEASLLGINFEWDVFDGAIELPGLGRVGNRP
ncbi:MAG: hypothetical protein ACI9YO_002066 [Gammaproteobacteria bacterium]